MAISVLLVDDEEAFVQTLAKRLTLIDVILLDVKMPDLDGIDATRDIKATYPLIEVILLTGHASMEASLEGMKLGAFDYLLKPVNIDELVYKIEDAHRKKELQEEKIRRLETRAGEVDGDQEKSD